MEGKKKEKKKSYNEDPRTKIVNDKGFQRHSKGIKKKNFLTPQTLREGRPLSVEPNPGGPLARNPGVCIFSNLWEWESPNFTKKHPKVCKSVGDGWLFNDPS
eukprot:TRINITY_DN3913_c0_g2_i1.p1 TRINITY_DN3913_c0_g2~~TRINITY_DN3913_c0_g2_i1.p1  ORF type:complete len:102 (-),score=6.35 TRINITY_DN3913_c0_g2_i1:318-623(-)